MMSCEFTAILKCGGAMLKLCAAAGQLFGPAVRERSWMRLSDLLSSGREWLRASGQTMAAAASGYGCSGFCARTRFPLEEAAT
jgi:hypothetical protein